MKVKGKLEIEFVIFAFLILVGMIIFGIISTNMFNGEIEAKQQELEAKQQELMELQNTIEQQELEIYCLNEQQSDLLMELNKAVGGEPEDER